MKSEQSSPEEKKVGRLGYDEMEFIDEKKGSMPPDEIAAYLNRNVRSIDKYLKKYPHGFKSRSKKRGSYKRKSQIELKPSLPLLEQVRSELTRSELSKFQKMWREVVHQLKYDVPFSEQKQIKDWIIFQIRADKEAIKQKELSQRIDKIVETIEQEEAAPAPDKATLRQLEQKHLSLLAELGESERLYQKYFEIQTEVGKDLLIKREQRVKTATDGKKSFIDLIKFLDDDEIRDKEGRDMVLLNMAADEALRRLGENHTYGDGSVDRPVYCTETLTDEDTLSEKDLDGE
jgi:hypothetical protein